MTLLARINVAHTEHKLIINTVDEKGNFPMHWYRWEDEVTNGC
jgi:hypothetical protein